VLTLIVIPVVYELIDDLQLRVAGRSAATWHRPAVAAAPLTALEGAVAASDPTGSD
jgi:hypothetical protein